MRARSSSAWALASCGGGAGGAGLRWSRWSSGTTCRAALQLALGLQQRGLGHIDPGLVIARIDAHQHLPGLDRLVVHHQHFDHVAGDLGRDGGDVAVHFGVVGGNAVAVMQTRRPTAPAASSSTITRSDDRSASRDPRARRRRTGSFVGILRRYRSFRHVATDSVRFLSLHTMGPCTGPRSSSSKTSEE